VGEILDLAIEILITRFTLLVGVAFLVWLPISWLREHLFAGSAELPAEATPAEALAAVLIDVVPVVASTALIGAVAPLVTFRHMGGRADRAGKLVAAVPSVLVVTLLSMAAFTVAFPLTCGLGAIFLWWKFLLAPCIAVVETHNPLRAMGRSWRLTHAGFWRWMALYLVATLITMPLSFASGAVLAGAGAHYLAEWFPTLPGAAIDAILLLVSSLLVAVPSALSAVVLTVFYVDLLVRREGWDLKARLNAFVEGAR